MHIRFLPFDPVEEQVGYEFRGIIGRYGFIEDGPVQAGMFDGPEDGIADSGRGKGIPDFSIGDTFVDNADDDPIELLDEGIGLTLEISFGISHFKQNNPGKDPMVCIPLDRRPDNLSQLVQGSVYSLQISFYLDQEQFIVFLEDMVQHIPPVLEVFVNQSFCDSGGSCDLRNSDGLESPIFQQSPQGLRYFYFSWWGTGCFLFHNNLILLTADYVVVTY